ncbi:hypothetical protein JW835_06210 [bacterium]|nr:hypothetical protein [bacterium]
MSAYNAFSISSGSFLIRSVIIVLSFFTPVFAVLSTAQYGSIRLSAHERDWKYGKEVVEIAQSSLPEINANLGLLNEISVHIVIAPTRVDFQQLTGNQMPDWGVAAADPREGVIFLKSPRFERPAIGLHTIIVHELCHIAMGYAVGKHSIPRWFDEGFALYQSGELGLESNIVLARSLISGQIIPLEAIDHVLTFRQQKAMLAYRESLAAVQYLVEQYGIEALPRLVFALSEGKTMDNAIFLVTGVSMTVFEDHWIAYLQQKYLWYAILDTRIILSFVFVVLFLWAWAYKKLRSRHQRILWERGDCEHVLQHDISTGD